MDENTQVTMEETMQEVETLRVQLASAEGRATGYQQAVADLAERLQAAERERDERVCDEDWRAKRIDIQKLRNRCEQMRKNLIAVDARADARMAEEIETRCAESKFAAEMAKEEAEDRVAEVLASVEPHIRAADAEAEQRIAAAESQVKDAMNRVTEAERRATVAERKLEMVRNANVHRVDALLAVAATAFAWDRRDAAALAAKGIKPTTPQAVINYMRDLACTGATVAK